MLIMHQNIQIMSNNLSFGFSSRLSPFFGLVVVIFVIFGSLIVGQSLAYVLIDYFFGLDIKAMSAIFDAPFASQNQRIARNSVLFAQGIGMFVGFILGGIAYMRLVEGLSIFEVNQNKKLFPIFFLLIFVLMFFLTPLVTYLVEFNQGLYLGSFDAFARKSELKAQQLTEFLVGIENNTQLFLAFFVVAVIPAVGEEIVFRGLIQVHLTRITSNAHVGVWVGAAIFSAIHFQFFGFLPRMLLGALLGYLYLWSGNLWYPIFGHFVNNAMALFVMVAYKQKLISTNLEKTDNFPLPVLLLSVIVVGVILYFFKKKLADKHSNIN